jgi:hypothetical protein
LSPVVVRPIALTITGFAVAVLSPAAGVALVLMAVLPALARGPFLPLR